MKKLRFVFWILLFSILLSIIPILFLLGYTFVGKILGFILIVSLSVALSIWRKQTIKQMAYQQRVRLNTNDRFWLNASVKFYKELNAKDKSVFEDRVGLILANVEITDLKGNVTERTEAIALCALATIFLWDLPLFVFENSKWSIGQNDLNIESGNVYNFSKTEIDEKLKDNFMLINIDDFTKKGYSLGCIANFLLDLDKRYKKSQRFSPYEEDFWNYFSKNKGNYENILKYYSN